MKDKLNSDKFVFNQKAIKYLSDIVNSTDLTEIEYKCADISIKISKNIQATSMQNTVPWQNTMNVPQATQCSPQNNAGNSGNENNTPITSSVCLKSVAAPVVGKIYVSEKPGNPPLIKVGDKVEIGQKIFIIEAMKVMNNVKATESGIVEKILIQDGQAVEFGQKLVELK